MTNVSSSEDIQTLRIKHGKLQMISISLIAFVAHTAHPGNLVAKFWEVLRILAVLSVNTPLLLDNKHGVAPQRL
jgi:hypothetical protein